MWSALDTRNELCKLGNYIVFTWGSWLRWNLWNVDLSHLLLAGIVIIVFHFRYRGGKRKEGCNPPSNFMEVEIFYIIGNGETATLLFVLFY